MNAFRTFMWKIVQKIFEKEIYILKNDVRYEGFNEGLKVEHFHLTGKLKQTDSTENTKLNITK